jgi:predicted RND superfamily exporter protein
LSLTSLIGRLVHFSTTHPLKVIVTVGLLTGLSLLGLERLKMGSSIYELFPQGAGPIADLAEVTKTFGHQQDLVVLVTGPDGPTVEAATREMARRLRRSALIRHVRAGIEGAAMAEVLGRSLFLLAGDDIWPQVKERLTRDLRQRVVHLRRLLLSSPFSLQPSLIVRDPLRISELILQGLESGAANRQSGLYASRDRRAALIFAQPRGESSDSEFCQQLHAELERLGAPQRRWGVRLQYTGSHLYAFFLAQALRRDLTVSSSLALLGIALIQFLFFRSLRLLPLSSMVAAVSLAWTLALAAFTVGGLNALSLSFAALCIGMGDDALIHITAQTRQFSHLEVRPRLLNAIGQVTPALVTATLTIVAAFVSFLFSSFAGLAQTGILAACGLALNAFLAMCFFPALAVLFPPGPGPLGTTFIDRGLEWLSAVAQRRRIPVLIASLVLGLCSLLAAGRLDFSEDLTRLAPRDLPPTATDQAIARHFERHRHRLLVLLEGRHQERVLQVNDRLAQKLKEWREQGRIVSYHSLASLLPSRATQEARGKRLQALQPRHLAQRLEAALEDEGLKADAFFPFVQALLNPQLLNLHDLPAAIKPLVSRYLSQSHGRTLVNTVVYLPPQGRPESLIAQLKLLATTTTDVQLRVTGADLAGRQMGTLLRRDLLIISLATLMAVLVLLGLLVRRCWPVIATLLSLALAGVLFIGCLRLLGLKLDLYNLMVIPIIIGYGVDDHLYLVHRSLDEGIEAGLLQSGRPVLAATLSTIAAFSGLAFCQLPGLRTLGFTGMLGLGLGLLASLIVMPALLALAPAYRPPPDPSS